MQGDPAKVKEARVFVGGVATMAPPPSAGSGGGGTEAAPDFADFGAPSDAAAAAAPASADAFSVPATAGSVGAALASSASSAAASLVAAGGGPGQPPTPLDLPLLLIGTHANWAAAVPVPRFSYADVGLRAADPVTGAFTLEMWAQVGWPFAGGVPASAAGGVNGGGGGGDEDEEGGMGAAARPSPGGGGAASLRLGRDLVLAGRTERFAGASSSAPSIGGGRVSSQWQWQLVVRRDASLAFAAFPLSSASSSSSSSSGGRAHLAPAPSVAASRPGAVPLGSWVHLAVTVDASGAARESAARLKSGGPAATTTPDATVRLFVDGEQLEEGPVRTAPPLPLLDPLPPGQALPAAQAGSPAAAAVAAGTLAAAAGTSDQLLIGPDFVGRLAEVRRLSGE